MSRSRNFSRALKSECEAFCFSVNGQVFEQILLRSYFKKSVLISEPDHAEPVVSEQQNMQISFMFGRHSKSILSGIRVPLVYLGNTGRLVLNFFFCVEVHMVYFSRIMFGVLIEC